MLLKIYDAHPNNSLMAQVEIDYKYQAEEWVSETKNEVGPDGKPICWDLHSGDKENPGPVFHRWKRQPDDEIVSQQIG